MTRELILDQTVFNVRQAAQYLAIGPRLVRRLCRQRKLKFTKIDGRGTIRIHRDVCDEFVKGGGR
jgi:excisionase family DNA binding protein